VNKPTSWSSREEAMMLLNAYIDNELDAASALEFERRLESDAALKAEHERLAQLRRVLASHLALGRAADALKARVAALGDPPEGDNSSDDEAREAKVVAFRPKPGRVFDLRQMAVAAMLAAIVGSGGTFALLGQRPAPDDIAAIVGDHRRALLAAAPFDVASSDRHTVKPWFDSKLALSPMVFDLQASGFPLAGGRVEILDGKPVPVIVYHRRAHVVSVVAVPSGGASAEPSHAEMRDGYGVIRWRDRNFEYFAVSDIPEDELSLFVGDWRKAALVQ
jgi:anti-sigma factor RsiW